MTGLRLAAIAEATTLVVLLFIAVPLKHVLGLAVATKIVGPVHGLAFLAFNLKVFQEYSSGYLSSRDTSRLLIGAFIPFMGFFNERWLSTKDRPGNS